MNHTPGHWKHGEGVCNHKVYSVAQPEKDEIVRCYGDTPEEAEANARLIAAAPELLEALNRIADMVFDDPSQPLGHIRAIIRVAIAKAGG